MINRRDFMKTCAILAGSAGISASKLFNQTESKKPNFIIVFTDDQGYQDVGCFGSPDIKTPNLDWMAEQGMKFTNFYSASSICSPSRAALLTGCYPPRVNLTSVLYPKDSYGLSPKEMTIAKALKSQNYATACIGKWHLGHTKRFFPGNHGFDYYFGIPYSNDMWMDPYMKLDDNFIFREGWTKKDIINLKFIKTKKSKNKVPLMRNDKVIEFPANQAFLTKRYTEEAVRFITQNKNNPFFLYLPHTMPHVPLFVSDDFKGKSKRGLYGDAIEEIDWSTGEILDALKKLNIDKNTIVVFTSDNGPWLAKEANGGSALPLRDGKFTTYEGGMRVPCIMYAPGKIPSGTVCHEIASTIDLLPTFAHLAGAEIPQNRIIDGGNIWPLMSAKKNAATPHEAFYYYKGRKLEAIRVGNWKLHFIRSHKKQMEESGAELFDLDKDISEKNNLARDNPEIVIRLKKMMSEFDKELKSDAKTR